MRRCALIAAAFVVLVPARAAALPPTWERGLNITAYWWQDLTGKRFATWLKRARDDERARWVTFVTPWYQDDVRSTQLRTSPGSHQLCDHTSGTSTLHCKTPSDAALRSAVRRAKRLGLHVVLRPQVEVDDGQPRDLIDAGPAWFDSYRALIRD
jgi:hypothetical protein